MELVFAETFGASPFESQDNVSRASERPCPFFLRYRDHDPHPSCASAGMQLSKHDKADLAGIYYEQADGTWPMRVGRIQRWCFTSIANR